MVSPTIPLLYAKSERALSLRPACGNMLKTLPMRCPLKFTQKKSLAKGDGGATTATDVRRLTHKRGKRSRKTTATDQEPVYTKWMTDEKWKHSEKYKTLEKWRGDEENGVEPKWRTEEKWKGDDEDRLDPRWTTVCY